MQLSTNNKGFMPTNLSEAMSFCEMLANSNMIPKDYVGKPQNILVAIQWGMEIGLAPMQSLQSISIINGRPSIWGDGLMALVQASPLCENIEEYLEGENTANPVAVCIATRKGRTPLTVRFSIEDAKRAGLLNKGPAWSAYPLRMIQHRARSWCLRSAFADVLGGLQTREEAEDYVENEQPVANTKPVRTVNPLDMIAPSKVEIPEQTIDPMVIEEAFRQDAEVENLVISQEIELVAVKDEFVATPYRLFVPNKSEPHAYFETLEAWQDGYEIIAEKTAQAGARPARERMTLLRELKEANEPMLKAIDTVVRARHTQAYQQRIRALGAAQ